MLSLPSAGPSCPDTYARPLQGRLPIECIHLSTRTGSCKELSHSASFLPPFRAAPAHFYACSSVCRELFVKFVRFSKNAIFRTFIGEKSKKGLVILPKKWYVVSNKGITLDTWPSTSGSSLSTKTFVFKIAIFFIYLLIIYPACPAKGKKSDDSTCTSHRFFFLSAKDASRAERFRAG